MEFKKGLATTARPFFIETTLFEAMLFETMLFETMLFENMLFETMLFKTTPFEKYSRVQFASVVE